MPIRLTRGGRLMVTNLDNVLFKYVSQGNPKSNDDLKRLLRLYPLYREEIIEFTATWRALSILEWVQPAPDSGDEQLLVEQAKAHLRTVQRRCEYTARRSQKGK